jgi:hypothetical protein
MIWSGSSRALTAPIPARDVLDGRRARRSSGAAEALLRGECGCGCLKVPAGLGVDTPCVEEAEVVVRADRSGGLVVPRRGR